MDFEGGHGDDFGDEDEEGAGHANDDGREANMRILRVGGVNETEM